MYDIYKKKRLSFLTKKLCHYSEVPLIDEDHQTTDSVRYHFLDGSDPDLSEWLLFEIGKNPEDYEPGNLTTDADGLHFNVRRNYQDKISQICISKKFETFGIFKFLSRFAKGKEGICSAAWLYYGHGFEKGGFVEYDFEHKVQELHSVHMNNHV